MDTAAATDALLAAREALGLALDDSLASSRSTRAQILAARVKVEEVLNGGKSDQPCLDLFPHGFG